MKILYFSPINWYDLKQRPQHIAEGLSDKFKLYYVEPSLSFIKCVINNNKDFKKREKIINNNLTVLRPSGKYRLPRSIEYIDVLSLNCLYDKLQLKSLIDECDIIWIGSPVYYPIVENIKNKPIIYDKMDDYSYLTNNILLKKIINRYENKLVHRANAIFVTSDCFFQKIKPININTYIIKNGVERLDSKDEFDSYIEKELKKIKNDNKIIFGYIGTVDHWFDYKVINEILNFNEKFCVVIIGKNNLKRVIRENIYYFDPISKKDVFSAIKLFDFCLYPFKLDEFINTINPVKIYEYLSCNGKVICAKSNEIMNYDKYLYIYSNKSELELLLKNIHNLESPFKQKIELENFIIKNSWNSRIEKIKFTLNSNLN